MKTWFTADCHYGHSNIIKLSKRHIFNSVEDMNDGLIQRWNSVVSKDDTIWVLGDVAFRQGKGVFPEVFKRLNGIKHLVIGNHDNDEVINQPWASIQHYKEIKLDGKHIVLSHYPMRSWNGLYRGWLHLYGHEHGNLQDHSNCLDVGVDKWEYTPVDFSQILARMATLTPWVAQTPSSGTVII